MNHQEIPTLQPFLEYLGTIVFLLLCMSSIFVYCRRVEYNQAKRLLKASDERWRLTVQEAGSGAWEWDIPSSRVDFSHGWLSTLGYKDGEVETSIESWKGLVHKEDLDSTLSGLKALSASETNSFSAEFRLKKNDGTYTWVSAKGTAVGFDSSGRACKVVGTYSDITSKKVADELMQLSALVYQSSSEAMMVTNRDFDVLSVNPAFEKITGFCLREVEGKKPFGYRDGPNESSLYEEMWTDIETKGNWFGEIWSNRKNGEKFLKRVTINTIRGVDNSIERYVILFSDVTKKRESEDIIWRQANFDALTGLPNRNRLQILLAEEISRLTSSGLEMAVMIMDLDGFKEINDTLGHDRGDLLLQETAARLKSCLRESDTIARMGGDEFIFLLPNLTSRDDVEAIANNLLRKVSKPYALLEDTAYVSASIGITFFPGDATEVDVLLKNADQAMYAAKAAGRNRLAYFTSSMQEAAHNRMNLANDLRRALSSNEFKLVYQPIIELATNRIHKAEALIRWNHPKRGLVSPAEFIPVAEETGAIIQIGDWVFKEAAKQAAVWRISHQANFQISVNVSPAQFKNERTDDGAKSVFLEHMGIVGESIVVEITEGLLLDASETVNERLIGFRDAGIQVSLDDFGTGYSSLSYLKKFDIDYIKIDQSFVRNMKNESDDLALCEAIIVMAHKLGMKVIAEGVETTEQRDLLLAAGCDYAQGYLFSRPVAPADLETLLSTGYIP